MFDLKGILKAGLHKTSRAIILCHRWADVDAYCSAYGMAYLLKKMNRRVKVEVAAPEGFSTLARRVIEKFPIELADEPDFSEADLIAVVDTGHAALLKEWGEKVSKASAKKYFVDHHPLSESVKKLGGNILVDEKASSTCEVVCRIFKEAGIGLKKDVAQVLLTGILADSQNLTIASYKTIQTVAELCREGASLEASRRLLSLEKGPSEKIARLKAAQRIRIFQLGRWLLAFTIVGSYQASAARALIELGADLAFAVGESDGGARGSLRAYQPFYRETGLHLGLDLAEELAKSFPSGVGGGHPTAASVSIRAPSESVIEKALGILKSKFGQDIKEVR